MKKLLLLIMLPFITFAQQEAEGELWIHLINFSLPFDFTFTLTAVGARWDENYELTEDYETVSHTISSSVCSTCTTGTFEHILHPGNYEEFAIGLYRISVIENGNELAYFYTDWRTSDWGESVDISFKYDVGNNRFRNRDDTETINYSYQTLWDYPYNEIILETLGLEDYWDNCLALINEGNNHYKLVWGPYPDDNFEVINYKIYRKLDLGNWVIIGTVNSETFSYIDEEIITGNKRGVVKYYIKAYDGSTETDPTNTVTGYYEQYNPNKVGAENSTNKQRDYYLSQNYPNPFNPATVISFSVAENSFITLKVYDVLGKEVMTLINEMLEAGVHQVEFNGSGLKSGVYFYEIRAKNFRDVKKLILLK